MKRKFLSLACALALLLTIFAMPANAATRVVDSDHGVLTVNNVPYTFDLNVRNKIATTTGTSSGSQTMSCSMSATSNSGVEWNDDSRQYSLTVTISKSDVIYQSTSHCGVTGTTYGLTLMVIS